MKWKQYQFREQTIFLRCRRQYSTRRSPCKRWLWGSERPSRKSKEKPAPGIPWHSSGKTGVFPGGVYCDWSCCCRRRGSWRHSRGRSWCQNSWQSCCYRFGWTACCTKDWCCWPAEPGEPCCCCRCCRYGRCCDCCRAPGERPWICQDSAGGWRLGEWKWWWWWWRRRRWWWKPMLIMIMLTYVVIFLRW